VKNLKRTLLLLILTIAAGCTATDLSIMPDCEYERRKGEQEYVFVLPSLEEYAGGTGAFDFYAEPRRSAKLRLSSFRYQREFAGKRYKKIAITEGVDGSYLEWLMEDCRLLFSPVEAGLPREESSSGGK